MLPGQLRQRQPWRRRQRQWRLERAAGRAAGAGQGGHAHGHGARRARWCPRRCAGCAAGPAACGSPVPTAHACRAAWGGAQPAERARAPAGGATRHCQAHSPHGGRQGRQAAGQAAQPPPDSSRCGGVRRHSGYRVLACCQQQAGWLLFSRPSLPAPRTLCLRGRAAALSTVPSLLVGVVGRSERVACGPIGAAQGIWRGPSPSPARAGGPSSRYMPLSEP